MRIHWVYTAVLLILLAGCAIGPAPTATPSPTLPPTETPTPMPTNTPPSTSTPPPTITVIAPSSLRSTTLNAYIAAADESLCEGSVPREFAVKAGRTDNLAIALSCVKRLTNREGAALDQQKTLFERGTCHTEPDASSETRRNMRQSEIWALDDLVLGYIELARKFETANQPDLADEIYQLVMDHYSCAWVYNLDEGRYASAVATAQAGLELPTE